MASAHQRLVNYLEKRVEGGYTIVTWIGLGFDFDVLAEESGMLERCRYLAINHVDMMFHALCRLGHGMSLDSAAKGMDVVGKDKRLHGALAPRFWADGSREEVLEHVGNDVKTTLERRYATPAGSTWAVGWDIDPATDNHDPLVLQGINGVWSLIPSPSFAAGSDS